MGSPSRGRPCDPPIDFFGDGTRIPLIVVSRFSRGVGVVHTYADHVSFDKFVEANWRLPPISARSRDNLPNPVTAPGNPYVPVNSPAIGNLMTMSGWAVAGRPHAYRRARTASRPGAIGACHDIRIRPAVRRSGTLRGLRALARSQLGAKPVRDGLAQRSGRRNCRSRWNSRRLRLKTCPA